MAAVERRGAELDQRRTQLGDDINRTREDLAAQQIRKRELEDSLALRNKQTEIEGVTARIRAEEARLGGFNVDNLAREKTDLRREHDRLQRDKETARSRAQVLEGEIVAFSRDLKEDMYRDADEKYRHKRIALRTTELANSDLDKYYKALDGTIMSYHNQKMAEINKIISELWRNTYRGNDIEKIEIRSDVEEESGASKVRRQYKYRVIMMRSGTELDMRGRCSAGQKVLASLIIRLALAETFCLNCGVLALDEPTTNLDRENIESLAFALDKIIENRSKQRNFQLIVITHDEDFLELLGRTGHTEEFFKVNKTEFGCSRLVRAALKDLHSK